MWNSLPADVTSASSLYQFSKQTENLFIPILLELQNSLPCVIRVYEYMHCRLFLIHDLLFLPISTIESAVGKRLITQCCVSRLAGSRLSGYIDTHSPRLQA